MRNASWLLAAAFFVLGVLSCAQGLRNAVRPGGSQDLQWGVSRLLLNHQSPYASFVEFKVGKLSHNPFPEVPLPVYPASAEIFLWPLAAFDFNYAKWLWAVANILFAIGTVVLLARLAGLSGSASLGLLGLFLASTPVRTTIGNGQHGLFSFFFFLLAVTLQYR